MNKTTLLSGAACVGVVATAVLSGRSALKAEKVLAEKSPEGKMETVKTLAPVYILPVASGVATIAAIIASHKLDTKVIAALTAAAGIAEEKYRKFKGKVTDILGEEKVQGIEAEIAKEDWGMSPALPTRGEGEAQLFYDSYSKRYFYAAPARVTEAIYHLNRNLQMRGYVPLNEFYDFLGIEENAEVGDIVGWSDRFFIEVLEVTPWIDIWLKDTTNDNGELVTVFGFDFDPTTEAFEDS